MLETSATSWCSGWADGRRSVRFSGTGRPMADLSRGATVDDIVEIAALAALQSEPGT
jgi:hypothetical protein